MRPTGRWKVCATASGVAPGILAVILVGLAAPPSFSQSPSAQFPPADTAPAPAPDLARRRNELADRIERLARLASPDGSTAGQPTAVAAANELKLLRALDLIYLQHQTSNVQLDEVRRTSERYQEELTAVRASTAKPGETVSWLKLDEFRDRLDAEATRVDSRAADLAQARTALEESLAAQNEVDRRRRRTLDEAALATPEDRAKLEYRRRTADLESIVAGATVELRRAELALKTAQQEAARRHRELLEAQVARMRPRATFTEADLEHRRRELNAYNSEIQKQLEDARRRLKAVDDWLTDDANASESASSERPAWSADTLQFVHGLCLEQLRELERRAADFGTVRDSATSRFKLHNRLLTEVELVDWRDTCERLLQQLTEEDRRLAARVGELLQDLTTLHRESRLHAPGAADAAGAAEIAAKVEHLERLLRTLEFSQRHVLTMRRAVGRFHADLEEQLADGATADWLAELPAGFAAVWNYELLAVGDQPITCGKITRGLLGFVVGLIVAAAVSRLLGRRLLPRIGLNPGASEALRTLSFYSLCLVFGVVSLELAHVPLTAFTFMGGAVAIGVGFGSQNILNNFISGLILLAEQPIRVGDLVELNSLHGTVERIGARSTTIRTGANVEIVVPNSKLLEDNVTNLTRSDNRFRASVTVGVAYGSPIAEVKRLLLQSARRPEVLESPEPFVLFADFADSTLTFELHFWVHIFSMTECRKISSDVREAIDAAFREAGVEMAFPQRDVNLTSARPLEIQIQRRREEMGPRLHRAA